MSQASTTRRSTSRTVLARAWLPLVIVVALGIGALGMRGIAVRDFFIFDRGLAVQDRHIRGPSLEFDPGSAARWGGQGCTVQDAQSSMAFYYIL